MKPCMQTHKKNHLSSSPNLGSEQGRVGELFVCDFEHSMCDMFVLFVFFCFFTEWSVNLISKSLYSHKLKGVFTCIFLIFV